MSVIESEIQNRIENITDQGKYINWINEDWETPDIRNFFESMNDEINLRKKGKIINDARNLLILIKI